MTMSFKIQNFMDYTELDDASGTPLLSPFIPKLYMSYSIEFN